MNMAIQRVDWFGDRRGETLQEAIDHHIKLVLADSSTMAEAAQRLGVNQSTLWRWRSSKEKVMIHPSRRRKFSPDTCRKCKMPRTLGKKCPGCFVDRWLKGLALATWRR